MPPATIDNRTVLFILTCYNCSNNRRAHAMSCRALDVDRSAMSTSLLEHTVVRGRHRHRFGGFKSQNPNLRFPSWNRPTWTVKSLVA